MPELPEVETVVRGLNAEMSGRIIRKADIITPSIITGNSEEFHKKVTNQQVTSVSRFGKLIYFHLENGIITSHLRMTGKYTKFILSNSERAKHDHLSFIFDDFEVVYNDTRRFGRLRWFDSYEESRILSSISGRDVLENNFTREYLTLTLAKSNKPLKALLLDQTKLAGIGNIYADEICFDAQILPFRKSSSLTNAEISLLYQSIHTILYAAIASGGSSISDYATIYGTKGDYADKHMVYGRARLPCKKCHNPLSKVSIGGRSTVFCSIDQH